MRAYFVLLTLIVLISGCINPLNTGEGGGPGVTINSFSFAPSNLKSNQLTKLSLSIENKGDYPIEDDAGVVYLFNLPNDWEITDKSDLTTNTETFSLLAPQVRGVKKYAGESAGFEWVLRAPVNLPKDELFSYTAQARVCYPYKTKIWGRLEVVSENAWLQKPPTEHSIAVQQTQGPLKVEFISKQPLMVETDVRIKIRITNVGDGVVTTNDCSVFATVEDDEEGNAINNLNHITLGDSDCTLGDELYLKKGQTKETYITCTPPALGNNPITTSDFTMELIYNYYSDKKASVSVTGTSEDASGGMIGVGGGVAGVITLTDPCTKMCTATGQKPSSGNSGNALGICATDASSKVTYPGTSVDVWITPLSSPSPIPSIGTGTATIKTLKLHDAKVSDADLQSMTLGLLDAKSTSIQYEKNTKLGPKIGILNYLCSAAISDSMTITVNGQTKGALCNSEAMAAQPLSNMITVNDISGNQFKDQQISGLTITSIAGRDVSTMTGGNFSAINVEDFKLSSLPFLNSGVLKYVSCDSKNVVSPYTDKVYCQCVIQVSAGYAKFDGTASAECTTACPKTVGTAKTPWADGGACDLAKDASTTECSGTTLYEYFSKPNAPTACTGNICLCYKKKTISSTESALLCKSTV